MAPRMKVEVEGGAASQQPAATQETPAPSTPKKTSAAPKLRVDGPAATSTSSPHSQPKVTVQATSQTSDNPTDKTTTPAAKPASAPQLRVTTAQQEPQDEPANGAAANEPTPEPNPPQAASRVSNVRDAATGWVGRTFPGHENAFWGGVVALALALLVFIIGFWRMLLICLLVFVGVAIGQVLDGDPKIIRMIRGLFDIDHDQR